MQQSRENYHDIYSDDTTSKSYFDKILTVASEKPFLTQEEEVSVFTELQTASEERKREIREDLTTRNMRLVMSIAKRFQNRGLELDDVFQAGILGLMHAIDKFDYTKGFRLSTYATWWIYQSVILEIHKTGKTIRIPVHVNGLMRKAHKFIETYDATHGRHPSVPEIAEALNVNKEDVENALEASRIQVLSTDRVVSEDGDLYDFLPSIEDDHTHAVFLKDVNAKIREALSGMTDTERYVIEHRYGLNGHPIESPGTIAIDLGIPRQRVLHIQGVAEKRLRRTGYFDAFKDNGE